MDQAEVKRIRSRLWRANNKERKLIYDMSRYAKFKTEGRLDEYYGNRDLARNKLRARLWRKMNQGRVNANLAKHRAALLKATPKWAEYDEIIHIYNEARRLTESTGIDYEVDHRVPLVNDLVCGLHCLDNLQILTADENNRKKCKLEE